MFKDIQYLDVLTAYVNPNLCIIGGSAAMMVAGYNHHNNDLDVEGSLCTVVSLIHRGWIPRTCGNRLIAQDPECGCVDMHLVDLNVLQQRQKEGICINGYWFYNLNECYRLYSRLNRDKDQDKLVWLRNQLESI